MMTIVPVLPQLPSTAQFDWEARERCKPVACGPGLSGLGHFAQTCHPRSGRYYNYNNNKQTNSNMNA
jgi:hypothetical protein